LVNARVSISWLLVSLTPRVDGVGYAASDIERIIIRAITSEDVYEALTGADGTPGIDPAVRVD
jgi:hypothetical protein